ncbi:hypothetical protein [Nocardia concava]|uniref:hypothetical protein n=1 Tax=Nocardia concava TaxID=257281 RepID=UPI0012F8AE65|nr:hypothetical protein [Nocardia concava]
MTSGMEELAFLVPDPLSVLVPARTTATASNPSPRPACSNRVRRTACTERAVTS